MLTHTFCHVPGIGPKTESALWSANVTTWDDVDAPGLPLPAAKAGYLRTSIPESRRRLSERDPRYFHDRLPAAEQWRLFSEFKDRAAYLDIETTGMGAGLDHITAICLYDGKNVRHYVYGDNLARFERDVEEYSLLVTFNGKQFDIPFIQRYFNIRLDHAHIDLRFVLKSLGFSGGLKACEKEFGLDRDELDGVDGYFAVLLWREFELTRDERALETLLAYNACDTINLETLMYAAYNLKLKQTPFHRGLEMDAPPVLANPFTPDLALVARLKARIAKRRAHSAAYRGFSIY